MKKMTITFYKQTHLRKNWESYLDGSVFESFVQDLREELLPFGVELDFTHNETQTVTVNSYSDLLNAVRVTSVVDGFMNKCVGHIIGQSQHLDLHEDIRRAVNRVAFAPETIQPDDSNRKVCHNCGCGC